jgi:hypothetical protein
MMPAATESKHFQPSDCSAPRDEIRPWFKLSPFAQNHNVRFLQNLFRIRGSSHKWENEQIQGTLGLCKQPHKILPRRRVTGHWIATQCLARHRLIRRYR